jgi:hypothetical protein
VAIVRPDVVASNNWTVSAGTAATALDDAVSDPTNARTSGDGAFVSSATDGQVCDVHLSNPTVLTGGFISQVVAKVFASGGSRRGMTIDLRYTRASDSSDQSLGTATVGADAAAAWVTVTASSLNLTVAEANSLRIRLTCNLTQPGGTPTAVQADAAYADVAVSYLLSSSPSGGIRLNGSRTFIKVFTGTRSGGIVLGGSALGKYAAYYPGATEMTGGYPIGQGSFRLNAFSRVPVSLTGAGELRLGIVEWSAAGALLRETYSVIDKAAHVWQSESVAFTATPLTTRISIRVAFVNVSGTVYLDDLSLDTPMVKFATHSIADTGLTFSDSVKRGIPRALTDTGLTFNVVLKQSKPAAITQVGLTLSASITMKRVTRSLIDGIVFSESLRSGLAPAGPVQQLVADAKRVSLYHFQQGRLPKVAVFCDARQPGEFGSPKVRAVVYARDEVTGYPGALIAAGVEVTVPNGQAPGWVDLPLWYDPVIDPVAGGDARGALIQYEGVYFVGVFVGEANALRVFQTTAAQPDVVGSGDSFANGPSNPFGTAAAFAARLMLNVPRTFTAWVPPVRAEDFYCASLPFPEAQKRFTKTGAASGTPPRIVSVSWHGTSLDAQRGSFAVLGTDSGYPELLGRRVQLTLTSRKAERSVAVYVHNELPISRGDISLSRRAFGALAELGEDEVTAVLEVLA